MDKNLEHYIVPKSSPSLLVICEQAAELLDFHWNTLENPDLFGENNCVLLVSLDVPKDSQRLNTVINEMLKMQKRL